LNKGDITKTTLPIVWFLFTLLAVKTYNLSSKLPMKMDQLHNPASRTSFSGTITSCRKTAAVLKLRTVIFAKFFISTAKASCWQARLMTGLQHGSYWKYHTEQYKNSMRCAKNFKKIILTTAISGMPTFEICFLPGQFRRTILPKEHHGKSLSVCELDTQPSNWEADALRLGYRRSSEIFVANASVSGDVMMCSWGITEKPKIRAKGLS